MKVHVVSYCPRGSRSRTRMLLDHAVGTLRSRGVAVDLVDIAAEVPDLLDAGRLSVYYRRVYAGEQVSAQENALLAGMDRLTDRLMAADGLIVAYPMYNFAEPAVVKAWFDAVMQKGKTWDMTANGYVGLLKGRKALVLTTSGAVYDGDAAAWDLSTPAAKVQLGFMGYSVEVVKGAGINLFPEKEGQILAQAYAGIDAALASWA